MGKLSRVLALIMMIFINQHGDAFGGDHIAPTWGVRVYDADYIAMYENTLNAMFDHDWRVISAELKYEDHEEICEHTDTRPQRFTEWTVEYRDGNGELRTFVFDNRESLASQIETYVTRYIADYYKANFYDVFLKDVPLAPSSYVFGSFVDAVSYSDRMQEATDEYQNNLDIPDGTICLSKLTPANVFEMCPIYLTVCISLGEYLGDKELFEKSAMTQVENMVDEMNKFTENHLTADISLGYRELIDLHTGDRKLHWTYVQGKQLFYAAGAYFERHVFDGYEGMFW